MLLKMTYQKRKKNLRPLTVLLFILLIGVCLIVMTGCSKSKPAVPEVPKTTYLQVNTNDMVLYQDPETSQKRNVVTPNNAIAIQTVLSEGIPQTVITGQSLGLPNTNIDLIIEIVKQ